MSRPKLNYKIYNGKNIKKLFENTGLYTLTILFSCGIIIGAAIINHDNMMTEKIKEFSDTYILTKSGQGISEIFLNSVISNSVFLFVNLFLSFSLIGYPIIIWIPFLKGLGIGSICGYLYSIYKFSGFGFSILTIFPGAIVSTFALISACNSACVYSKNAYSKAILGKGQFEKGETRFYIIKQMIYFIICAASSLIDSIFSFIFSRFFEL